MKGLWKNVELAKKVQASKSLWNPLRWYFLSFILCPPGLRFDGPDASIYKARVLFPASLCTWYPVLRPLPMPSSPSGGWSRILTEPPSRLNIRHESEVGGGGRVPVERTIFPAMGVAGVPGRILKTISKH